MEGMKRVEGEEVITKLRIRAKRERERERKNRMCNQLLLLHGRGVLYTCVLPPIFFLSLY